MLGSAESAWLPSISATGGVTRTFGDHVNVEGIPDSADQTTKDAAVNLSWTVYDFGGREGKIRSARSLLDADAANVSRASQQTVFAVVQAYYGVVAADEGLIAAQGNEAAGSQSLDVARGLQQGGVATAADVLQAQTAYEQYVLARVQATYTARSAHGSLAVALGLTADQGLQLAADPIPTEIPALTARMADLMTEAMRQRPDLAAAQAQRDSAVADVRVARSIGWPSISIGAGHSFAANTGLPNQNYNTIGVTVTVPIFTGL